MNEPKVFIIILNWNNWPDTLECLKSVKKIDYKNQEIIVVDNGSDEKIKITDSGVRVIYSHNNLGFSGGNNVGIWEALKQNVDYVLLLNNDMAVASDFLNKLVEIGERDKTFGIIGPKMMFYNEPRKIWSAGGKINKLFNRGEMVGYGEMDNGQYDKPEAQETEYITGACLLIKKEVIEKIGLMPQDYFLYYEDTDWCLGARRAGYKCVFTPGAVVFHKGSRSSKVGSPAYIYYHTRNGLILSHRFAPFKIKILVHLDVFWRVIKQIVKLIFFKEKMVWAKSILLGIRDFYLGRRGKYRY